MSKRAARKYDDIHTYVERIEDVLLSESSWSTSDSECSGCLHLSKASIPSESDHDCREPSHLPSLSKRSFRARKRNSNVTEGLTTSGVHHSAPTLEPSEKGMLQQLSLLTAGAQPWHRNICTAHQGRFAYAATLVIYVYQEDSEIGWKLHSILAEHTNTITSIEWHPCDPDLIASAAMDKTICIWSVDRQCPIHALNLCKAAMFVSWCTGFRDLLSFSTCGGPVQVWKFCGEDEPKPFRNDHAYSSGVVAYAWHPRVIDRLIIGHADGKLSLFREDTTKSKSISVLDGYDDKEAYPSKIIGLAWDHNSSDYLLIAYQERALWLADVSNFHIVTKFTIGASATVSSVAWIPNAPGMFVTGDMERGVLRVWTVSRKSPMENFVLKETGFHMLSIVPQNASCEGQMRQVNVLPKVSILSLFIDGGIGVYSLKEKEWIFKREHGHTETIFDCCFKPEDSDLLATASFDGSIKIWRVDTMETVVTLPNRCAIIYSISWAPADLNCIVAGSSSGSVFIWDLAKHKILQEFTFHKDKKVYCVAWNSRDSRKIASAGESNYCYVTGINGSLLQEYKHPGAVYGCHWRDGSILATGCDDGRIRIFDVNRSSKDCLVELKAHKKKVFGVKWNPVHCDVLCSGSDDASIKIWSYSKAQCLAVLIGHTDNIRGLAWCPEVPFLLISGSWDRSIRVWDVTTCSCLDSVHDHRADIYGLSIHPLRPFLLASCSRDSTVRLWSLNRLVNKLQLKVFSNGPLDEIVASKESETDFDSCRRLCGLRADFLLDALSKTTGTVHHENRKLKLFADLFCADVHVRNLWDLVHVLQGNTEISSLSIQYPNSIVHHTHILKCALATASDKESLLAKSNGFLSHSQVCVETQQALASLYLSCGALQAYCELMVKMLKWDHALALAPGVSMEYWKQLISRRCDDLVAEDSQECVPYLLAAKDVDRLIQYHVARGHVDQALSSSVALMKHKTTPKAPLLPAIPSRNKDDSMRNVRLLECTDRVAELHLRQGSPISAACSYLAVNNVAGALCCLLRGNELELSVVVGRLLSDFATEDTVKVQLLLCTSVRYLVYRSCEMDSWEMALDLVNTLADSDEANLLKSEVILLSTSKVKGRDDLYTLARLPPQAMCSGEESDNLVRSITLDLISTQPHIGFRRAIEFMKDCLLAENLNSREVWDILRLMQCYPMSRGTVKADMKANLLAISSFLGAVKASVLQYTSIVVPLLDHCKSLLVKYAPVGLEFMLEMISDAKTSYEKGVAGLKFELSAVEDVWVDRSETMVGGSHLPRHADCFVCCITHQIIKGPRFFLEDHVSAVALNDAIMWAKVNPFSPLGTGCRLAPF